MLNEIMLNVLILLLSLGVDLIVGTCLSGSQDLWSCFSAG